MFATLKRQIKSVVLPGWIGPAVVFISFACLSNLNLIIGFRRITHDTRLIIYPMRVFLSDSLHNGIFPFWDSFSSPGVSTSDFTTGLYYPLGVVLSYFFHYSPGTMVFEFLVSSIIAMVGTFLWLRIQSISKPLSMIGAIAFAGSAQFLTSQPDYPVTVSLTFMPWLFLSTDLIIGSNNWQDRLKGVIVLSLSTWMIATGGYFAVTYMIYLSVSIFSLIKFVQFRKSFTQIASCIALSVGIATTLLFLPLSEFATLFLRHFSSMHEAVLFSGIESTYQQSLSLNSILTLWLPNGSYLSSNWISPIVGGWGQMYIGLLLMSFIPVGMILFRAKRQDVVLLSIALAIIFGSMGSDSPIAVFFVNYIPGFAETRWHAWYSGIAAFLLIVLSIRLLQRFQSEAVSNPVLRRKFLIGLLLVVSMVLLLSSLDVFISEPIVPLDVIRYDFYISIVILILSFHVLVIWFRHLIDSKDFSRPFKQIIIILLSLLIILGLISLLFNLFPLMVLSIDEANWDWVRVRPSWLFAMDVFQVLMVLVGLFFIFVKSKIGKRRTFSWLMLGLVFADMFLASQRYTQASPGWMTVQIPREVISRSLDVQYNENSRDEEMGLILTDEAKRPLNGYRGDSAALLFRIPTYVSYNPIINSEILTLMTEGKGKAIFSKLIWLLPQNQDILVNNFENLAIEPIIQKLALEPNKLNVVVDSSQPSLLVWTDAWAPGWNATIDGKPVDIVKVLDTIKGVEIPKGISEVEFKYCPPYFEAGIASFIVGLFLLGYLGAKSGLLFKKKGSEPKIARNL